MSVSLVLHSQSSYARLDLAYHDFLRPLVFGVADHRFYNCDIPWHRFEKSSVPYWVMPIMQFGHSSPRDFGEWFAGAYLDRRRYNSEGSHPRMDELSSIFISKSSSCRPGLHSRTSRPTAHVDRHYLLPTVTRPYPPPLLPRGPSQSVELNTYPFALVGLIATP